MRSILFVFVGILITPFIAIAHEPNYIGVADRISIPDPTTSRAYYGELTGRPAVYTITLSTNTDFYLNILAPDIAGARTDFSAIMRNASGTAVVTLASDDPWPAWYEDFAGDTYLKGPEAKTNLSAGIYTITVSNSDNSGKYSLAPGEAEIFTIPGVPHTIQEIYWMKTKFFGKPWYSIFEGIIGHVLLALCIILIILIFYVAFRLRTRVQNN